MCGIAGIFAYRAGVAGVDPSELQAIRDHMRARGPDGSGEWISGDGRVGLGHRRLSIIDLSDRAAQPMTSADGTLVISFNGEIYNYRALREKLVAKGHVFRTTSDTEVLLHLYADVGEAFVDELRGMFAFALWDARERTLLLARDAYGIKPLYYADDAQTLRFASQVKALIAGGKVERGIDPAAQVGFLLLGSVPEPWTWHRAIKALPAGHVLSWREGAGGNPRPFYSIERAWAAAARAPRPLSADELQREMRAALLDTTAHHQVADVAVGAFLSAGVDSGALLGLMTESARLPVHAITLGFDEFAGRPEDETTIAAAVARRYGAQHATRRVGRAEFAADLPAILSAMDQPSIDGVNSWFVSKATHESGLKVAISGLGGDELLGGYPSFRDVPRWQRWLRVPSRVPFAPVLSRHVAARVLPRMPRASPKLASLLEYGGSIPGAYLLRRGLFMPWELGEFLPPDTLREGLATFDALEHIAARSAPDARSAFACVASLEAALYMRNQLLRDADWASMAWSLEVRVPLVDRTLLERVAPLLVAPGATSRKGLLARAPLPGLPADVVARPKTGFTTPIAAWLEQSSDLGRWRDRPSLRRDGCHWSRRFAYDLLRINGAAV